MVNWTGGYRIPAETKMERFVKIVNGWKLLAILAKRYMLDAWQNSDFTSVANHYLQTASIYFEIEIQLM